MAWFDLGDVELRNKGPFLLEQS